MKYRCEMHNRKTGQTRFVVVTLEPEELAAISRADDAELITETYALRHAYRAIGSAADDGETRHVVGGVKPFQ
jgi:hypothetical protein